MLIMGAHTSCPKAATYTHIHTDGQTDTDACTRWLLTCVMSSLWGPVHSVSSHQISNQWKPSVLYADKVLPPPTHNITYMKTMKQPVVNNIDSNYMKFLMGRQVLHTYKVTPGRLGISYNQLFLLFCLHVVVTWWNTKLAIPSWTGQNILLPENSV